MDGKMKCEYVSFPDLKLHSIRNLSERLRFFCFIILFVAVSVWWAEAQTPSPDSPPKITAPADLELRLSPEAKQTANQIGVTPLLGRLERVSDSSPANLESMALRQEITEKVLAASLDIDSVNSVIDTEIEQIRVIRSDLQTRRDKAQNIINLASLVTGGVFGVVNTALQFNSKTANLGNGIGVGGGAASVVLSVVGIRKQNGGRRVLGDSPRMLARFFGRQPIVPEIIRSEYPDEIWLYLNSVALFNQSTDKRREQLIAKWRGEGRIKQGGSLKSERKIDTLSGDNVQSRKLNIGDLDDRVAMLLDVRAVISLMKRDLSEILRSLNALK